MTPRCFKCSQFPNGALDINLECTKLLQNDFRKQRYITLNATIPDQDSIYPKTHLCRTFFAEYSYFVRQPSRVVHNTARLPYENTGSQSCLNVKNLIFDMTILFAIFMRFLEGARLPQGTQRLLQDCCKACKVFVRLT